VDTDSLYGDLVQVMNWILEAEDDIWDEEDYVEARERIIVELEDQRTILVIDGRVFTSEVSGEMLERLLTYLLNEATLKILLITASDSSRWKARHSRSDESIVHLGPLDFKSSALLFGNSCSFVTSDGNSVLRTAEEFQKYLVPPSLGKRVAATEKKGYRSRRQQELYDRIGMGIPRDVIHAATSCSENDLYDLLRLRSPLLLLPSWKMNEKSAELQWRKLLNPKISFAPRIWKPPWKRWKFFERPTQAWRIYRRSSRITRKNSWKCSRQNDMTMPTFQIDRKFCYTQRSGIISHIGRTIAPVIEECQQMRHDGILGHIPRFLRISICFSKDVDDLAETIGVHQNMIAYEDQWWSIRR
jgi:hypothetical protein